MKFVALLIAAVAIAQPPSIDRVLAQLDDYLDKYEPKLSELIADETMSQELKDTIVAEYVAAEIAPFGQHGTVRRRLTSEVAFISLPNEAWLGFRHVKSVNRKAIGDEQSLATSLRASTYDSARMLLEASAQHNLGLRRTTNLPNLPLEFLHRRNRHRLLPRLDGNERVRGVNATRVVLLERVTPTLIRHPEGQDMPSVIRAWIDPRDGKLLRAEVNTFANSEATEADNSVRVEFEPHGGLGLLVPVEMTEKFPGNPGKGTSSATYSNYRRFQTSARIVPQ